jgi:RNA polymerase sigma-70 factor, ECF subfamily
MLDDSGETDELIRRAQCGDESALARLFQRYRPRLKKMVKLRLDRRLQGRVDASDVLQEAFIDLAKRLPEYGEQRSYPFFLWLRLVTGQRLSQFHRRHLGAAMRDAALEISLCQGMVPQASSVFLASQLLGRFTSITEKAVRAELQLKLQEILNTMEPLDQEILALRHFEEMSNDEAAQAMKISSGAASKRYIRALRRLRDVLVRYPGFFGP